LFALKKDKEVKQKERNKKDVQERKEYERLRAKFEVV